MITESVKPAKSHTKYFAVAPGVWGMKDIFVNIYMVTNPADNTWVLIDAGLKNSAPKILKMAADLFGEDSAPSGIILTHAHFDHVGSLAALVEHWKVPVYAHYLELPFLTGKSSYPPPDPTVGGGVMPLLSVVFPTKPVNLWSSINALGEDGKVPGLPDWKFLHTPGHAPGHVSIYREDDGVLIAGDAFITTNQQSAFSVMFQTRKLCGPPRYFTYDWTLARQSVKDLMKLEPEVVATGHGKPMDGTSMRRALHHLYDHFYEDAVPNRGRYVKEPAVADPTGFIYIPPSNYNKRSTILTILGVTVVAVSLILLAKKKQKFAAKHYRV